MPPRVTDVFLATFFFAIFLEFFFADFFTAFLAVFLAVFFGCFFVFYFPGELSDWLACAIFVIAAFTDYLDGFFARLYKLQSKFGELLDPIADKVLVFQLIILQHPIHNLT